MIATVLAWIAKSKTVLLIALAGIVLALIAWAVLTIKGWHDDAALLPAVTQERDDARAATSALDARATATLTSIAAQLQALQARTKTLESLLKSNGAAVDAAVTAFRKDTEDAPSSSVGDAAVRQRLLDLIAIPAGDPKPGAASGDSNGAEAARLSGAAAFAFHLPRWVGTGAGAWRMALSRAGIVDRGDPIRAVQGCGGGGRGVGAEGGRSALPASRLVFSLYWPVIMDDADRAQVRETAEREAAIARMKRNAAEMASTVGKKRCIDCGDLIPLARRRACPTATRCIDCQRDHDRITGG